MFSGTKNDRLMLLIALERSVRCVLLVAIGIALLTHTHTDWGGWLDHLARSLGFAPAHNTLGRLVGKLHHLTPGRIEVYGFIAVGYGVLEGCEGYGLFRRRAWGEYLTVFATSILLIPEVDELITKASVLKLIALVVNLIVVAYLVWRLQRTRRRPASGQSSAAA